MSLVVVTYLLPVAAVSHSGLDPNSWTTGGWVDAGRALGGEWLAVAITISGIIGAIGVHSML